MRRWLDRVCNTLPDRYPPTPPAAKVTATMLDISRRQLRGHWKRLRNFRQALLPWKPTEGQYPKYQFENIGYDEQTLDWAIQELKGRSSSQDAVNAEHTEKSRTLLTASSLIVASSIAAGIYQLPDKLDWSSFNGIALILILMIFAFLLFSLYQAVQIRTYTRAPQPIWIANLTCSQLLEAKRDLVDAMVRSIVENDTVLDFRGRWIANGWIALGVELGSIIVVLTVNLLR